MTPLLHLVSYTQIFIWKLIFDEESDIINQEKIKVLLNDFIMINVEQWTQTSGACVAKKLKPWNTLSYRVWDTNKVTHTVWMYLWNSLFLVKLQTAVLQLSLIWAPPQILEHVIVFQRQTYSTRNSSDGVLCDISYCLKVAN